MAKQVFILFTIFAGMLISGCDNNQRKTATAEAGIKNFNVPDSIRKDLIIAMYDETEPAGRALLVYNDETRTGARKITYYLNQPAAIEKLVPLRYNEFKAPDANREYVIREKTITAFYTGNSSVNVSFNWSSDSPENPLSGKEYALLKN